MDRIVVMTGWPLADSEGRGGAGRAPGLGAALRRERRVDAWSAADAVDFTGQGAGVRIRVAEHSTVSCERPREFARNDILGNHCASERRRRRGSKVGRVMLAGACARRKVRTRREMRAGRA